MRWRAVYTATNERHVLPLADLREHAEQPSCWCRPKYEDGIYIHHSADRRELYETGELKRH